MSSAASDSDLTIEAHIDATCVPAPLADRLIELGFEPDGFAIFLPAHFAEHFTLKFKIASGDIQQRRALRNEAEKRAAAVMKLIEQEFPEVEAYLELEVYPATSRRRWPDATPRPHWVEFFPFAAGALKSCDVPCTEAEAAETGRPILLQKRADLHPKLAKSASESMRKVMISALESAGFYRVRTWAANDVCTAQFPNLRDAKVCFNSLSIFWDGFGGCSEMTMEPVAHIWRSRCQVGSVFSLAVARRSG